MNRHAVALRRRQQALLMRSGELRSQLAEDARAWQKPLAWADQVHAGWRWLRGHPEAPLAVAGVLLLLRPRRVWRWGWRLWSGWRLWLVWRQRLPAGLQAALPGTLPAVLQPRGVLGLVTSLLMKVLTKRR